MPGLPAPQAGDWSTTEHRRDVEPAADPERHACLAQPDRVYGWPAPAP